MPSLFVSPSGLRRIFRICRGFKVWTGRPAAVRIWYDARAAFAEQRRWDWMESRFCTGAPQSTVHVCSCSVLLGVGRPGASRARHLLCPNSTGARDRNGLLGSDFLPVFRLQAYSCKLVCYLLYATLNCYIRLRNPLLQRKPQQSCTGAR